MIVVTGANGFIGRSLMLALERSERTAAPYLGRIGDALALRDTLADASVVIHLAGAESRGRTRLLRQTDVLGTERLIRECRRAKVDHLIVVSRLNANPSSLYPLLRAKGEVELRVKQSELPYTVIRSATLFGRDDRFLNVIASLAAWSWPFVWCPGGGRVAMQPLWVEDMVRCLLNCLDRPDLVNATIEVAGAERLRYAEIVRLVQVTAKLWRRPIAPSVKLVRPLSSLLFGWWRRPPVTRFYMDRFTVPEVAPIDAVVRHFGFQPARIGNHIAYLRRTGLRRQLFRLS